LLNALAEAKAYSSSEIFVTIYGIYLDWILDGSVNGSESSTGIYEMSSVNFPRDSTL